MGNILSVSVSCDACFSHCRDSVREGRYIWDLEHNTAALQTALEKLAKVKNDVMTRIVISEQHQMKRLHQVQGWLSRVEAVETEVYKLMTDSSQEVERLCVGGFCSKNCKVSHRFGKELKKKMQDVSVLMDEGDFSLVAEKIPEAAVDERPIDPTIIGTESIFDKVWRCLGEKDVGALLTQINNKFIDM